MKKMIFFAVLAMKIVAYANIADTVPLASTSREDTLVKGAASFLNKQNEEVFPLAKKYGGKDWFFVDIKPECNINIFSKAGKTCPVKFLFMETGKRKFYGIPFDIIPPKDNSNKTAIALPSMQLMTGEIMPTSYTAKIGKTAKVLYILHTAYYASDGKQNYVVNYGGGSSQTIEIVKGKNISDWYHQKDRLYSEDVKYVLVPAQKGSKTHFRNLHILQWTNPSPNKKVKSITFNADKKSPMGMFIIAVTGHE